MKSHRIGKDLSITWSIYRRDGASREPYAVDAGNCMLYIVSEYGKEKAQGFAIDGHVISWTFYGRDQRYVGRYSLELVQRSDKDGMLTIDTCDAFALVPHTCQETDICESPGFHEDADARRIRIGKDFDIHWGIFRCVDGQTEPVDLSGRDLELRLVSEYGKEKAQGFAVDGHVISWTFYGRDQRYLGAYSLELVERHGKAGMITIDTCKAFELVAHTCQETQCQDAPVDIKDDSLVGDLSVKSIELEGVVTAGTVEMQSDVELAPYLQGTVDTEFSPDSDNPLANYVITAAFGQVETKLTEVDDSLTRLTADVGTEGSVDNKIRRAVSWGRIEEL